MPEHHKLYKRLFEIDVMVFKLNISEKGKSWKVELDNETFVGKQVGEAVKGEEIKPELSGYELEITGGSDNAGFPLKKEVEGVALKRVLLTKGWGMRDNTEGMRRRKTVRGKSITLNASQINLSVKKAGSKSLAEIFPEQNKPKEEKKPEAAAA